VNDRRELVDSVAAKDGIVQVYEVNNIKGYDFRPHGGILTEGHIDIIQRLDSFVAEAIWRVLRFLQVFSFKSHARKTLPGQYICRAAIIHQDSSNIITEVVLSVLADVRSYDEWVIVGVVLQPNVSGRESY
jgi:hypothetical protein